jgi:hypothetical protein
VIVTLTIWRIVDHVKGRSLERLRASGADETFLMIPTSQPPISRGNGFAGDRYAAAFAVSFLRRSPADGFLTRT